MKKLLTLILCAAMLAPSAYATEIANEQSALAAASYMLDAAQEDELLCRINEAEDYRELESIIFEYHNLLVIAFEAYNSLTSSQRNEVLKRCMSRIPYHDLDEFCRSFSAAISAVKAPPVGGGGGQGGGGSSIAIRRSSISTYTLDTNKNPFSEAPADGTNIIYTIQPRFQGTPCRYAVAIYDENNTLTEIKTFHSQATQKNESEFFDFPTKYYENRNIKIMSLDADNLSKPVDTSISTSFCAYGEGIPTPEAETDGITAYRGIIRDYTAASFEFKPTEMRAFGYWGSGPDIDAVVLSPPTPLLPLADAVPDSVYNLKRENGRLVLYSVDTQHEVISFSPYDLVGGSFDSITINKNNAEMTYSMRNTLFFENYTALIAPSTDFFDNMYFTALVQDEEITAIHGLSFKFETVDAVCDGQLIINGEAYPTEYVPGELPDAGDEVFIEYIGETPRITKHTPVVGTFTENGIVCSDKTYYWSGIEYGDYIPGETCLAFIEPYGDTIVMIKSNPATVSTLYATAINENILTTDIGDIDLSANNVQAYLWGSEVENGDFPCALMCEIYGDNMRISGMPAYSVTATYSTITNTIGGYVIDDDTEITAVNSLGIFKSAALENGSTYNVKIYSENGITADAVLIKDDANVFGTETVYMLADYNDGSYIYGYIGDEYTKAESALSVTCGDLIKIKRLTVDKKVVSVINMYSPLGSYFSEYTIYGLLHLPVAAISGDVLITQNSNGVRLSQKVTAETQVYKYDFSDGSLTTAAMSDIFYNPTYPEASDWVMVHYENSIAKQILIIKR